MVEQPARSRKKVRATTGFMTNSCGAESSPTPRCALLCCEIKSTLTTKPYPWLLLRDRIPIQPPSRVRVATVLARACDVRTMLAHDVSFEDLVPLLTLGDRWRLAAHRAGGRIG
jgi:hypothetical protein